jgi:hypothetical protein
MQRVRMLKTVPGVLEGEIYPRSFKEGEEYEINDSLVRGFMEQGACQIIDHGVPDAAATPTEVEAREIKVEKPAETKPAKPVKGKK